MARSLLLSVPVPMRPRHLRAPRGSIPALGSFTGSRRIGVAWRSNAGPTGRNSRVMMAAVSELPSEKRYPRIKSDSTGPIPPKELLQVVELAAKTGAEVTHISLTYLYLGFLFCWAWTHFQFSSIGHGFFFSLFVVLVLKTIIWHPQDLCKLLNYNPPGGFFFIYIYSVWCNPVSFAHFSGCDGKCR